MLYRHASNLLQLDNGKKIPPSGWQCEQCDLHQNLWLNLTDGAILCGRKFFDGSGGNDHAVEHYRATSKPSLNYCIIVAHDKVHFHLSILVLLLSIHIYSFT